VTRPEGLPCAIISNVYVKRLGKGGSWIIALEKMKDEFFEYYETLINIVYLVIGKKVLQTTSFHVTCRVIWRLEVREPCLMQLVGGLEWNGMLFRPWSL